MRRSLPGFVFVFLAGCTYSMVQDGQLRSADFRRVLARTAATRGLPLPAQLVPRVIHREDLAPLLKEMFYDEWTEAELRDAEEVMTTVGLWPDGADLLQESIALQRGEIAGVYSPPRRTLYVVEGVEVPAMFAAASAMTGRDLYTEFVLSHEIVHALQHNAFPKLFDATRDWKDQDDVVLALHAALEGDAIRYGFEVVAPDAELPGTDEFLMMEEQYLGNETYARAPALLRYSLLFPYVYGYPLSVTEGKRLLDEPPVSTEQAMRPEKRAEAFTTFDLTPATDRLPSECRVVGENTMGELLISILFRSHDQEIEQSAWEGWDGDRYLVARCDGRRELFWLTSWDSEDDAREFAAAYAAIAVDVQASAGLGEPLRVETSDRNVVVSSAGLAALASGFRGDLRTARVSSFADLQNVAFVPTAR